MKRCVTAILLLALLLPALLLSSCGKEEDLTDPKVQEKKLEQMLSAVENISGVTVEGEFRIDRFFADVESRYMSGELDGTVLLSKDSPSFSLRGRIVEVTNTADYSLYFNSGVLHTLEKGSHSSPKYQRTDVKGVYGEQAEPLGDMGAFVQMLDSYFETAVRFLDSGSYAIDLILSEMDAGFACDDLLALTEALYGYYRDMAVYVGYTPSLTFPEHEGSAMEVLDDFLTVEWGEQGGYVLTLTHSDLIDLLSRIAEEIKSYSQRTVSAVIDEMYGRGSAAAFLAPLDTLRGDDTVSVLIARVEESLADAEIDAEQLRTLVTLISGVSVEDWLAEHGDRTVDEMLGGIRDGLTWAEFSSNAKTYIGSVKIGTLYAMGLYPEIETDNPASLFESDMDALLLLLEGRREDHTVQTILSADRKMRITEIRSELTWRQIEKGAAFGGGDVVRVMSGSFSLIPTKATTIEADSELGDYMSGAAS